MNDIVERLRAEATDNRRYEVNGTLAVEAADEITRLRAENERRREVLRAAFDAGSELGWDHATYSERGGPEPIGHDDAFAAFLAALGFTPVPNGQPAPGKGE